MRQIAGELEGIQEREIGRLHSEFGEEIDAVKLGSELFKWAWARYVLSQTAF